MPMRQIPHNLPHPKLDHARDNNARFLPKLSLLDAHNHANINSRSNQITISSLILDNP